MSKERRKYSLPPLSFRARIFAALVGISATTSLVIGLVLYYFAEDRLVAACVTPRPGASPLPKPTPRSWSGRSPTRRGSACSTWGRMGSL
ncbi:MAG: hypothetical protein LC740_01330 [Actinobacteria bacterium]|nr:hypothetical protein [Actinomycetota bacterium]